MKFMVAILVPFVIIACTTAEAATRPAIAPAAQISTGSSTSAADRDAALDAMARDLLADFVAGRFEAAAKNFNAKMMEVLPPAKLREVAAQLDAQLGKYKSTRETRHADESGYRTVILVSDFENAVVDVRVVFDTANKVAGLFFKPSGG